MTAAPLISRLFIYTAIGAVIAGAAMPHRAAAASFYLQDQSVKGLGRAYSGEVADQGAESLWWNPAAIARSPNEIYIGENSILTSSTVQDRGSSITYPGGATFPTGGDPRAFNPVEFGVVPNGAVSYRLNDRFAIGLSTAAPYDFTSTYSSNSFARYNSLKSRLTTIDIAATGAMRVTDWLDLGVSVNTEYTSANLGNALPNLSPLLPDGQETLRGDGWNVGYTVGAQAHFGQWEFGASYKSAMDHDLSGTATVSGLLGPLAANNFSTGAQAHFTTPWIATVGARYHLTPKLTLNVQAERFGWSEFGSIDVKASALLSENIVQGYRDTTSGAVGVDYKVTDKWVMRAGVGYDQSPTQTKYRNSFVPDSDRMLYTIGTSFKPTQKLTVDAGFGYVAFRGSHLDYTTQDYPGTPLVTNFTEKGNVSGEAKILSVGARYAY